MLLTELTGVKAYNSKTGEQILAALEERHGIQLLGAGRFAVTLGHESWNYVIKAFPRDDCYMKFLEFASRNQSNPHLPEIVMKPKKMTAFFKRNAGNDTYYVAKIERLYPLNAKDVDDMSEMFSKPNFFVKAGEAITHDTFDLFLTGFSVKKYKDLIKTIVDITQDGDADCFTDIHDNNLMKRIDGTIVVTDPIAGFTKDEEEYLSTELKKFSVELWKMMTYSGIWGEPVEGPAKKKDDDKITRAADFLSKAMK